ncbi:MAG: hypothetical protein AABN34_18350 [Acidobacteriota bacterium]
MRAKLVTFGFTAAAILALVLQASSQAIAQGNANKPAAANRAKPAPKPPQAKPAPPAPAAGEATMAAKPKPKPKPKRKASMAMAGVPMGVPACIKHLTKMAEKDPLIDYDGHPSEIINGGLLWNDPKSRCSIAGDEATKKKVVELAIAWRSKDASKVRSLLQELEGMAK